MPISRTIREQITGQLRDDVLSGTIGAGAVLREAELAERFGVSRGPVRDAFLQLSNEGYLAYVPNRGVTVRHPPDQADRDFIATLRRQIEGYIVTKSDLGNVVEHIGGVRAALEDLRAACGSKDVRRVKRADLEFHAAVLLACGGDSLLPSWKQLCARMVMAYERHGSLSDVFDEHLRIFEALEAEDAVALREAIEANIR